MKRSTSTNSFRLSRPSVGEFGMGDFMSPIKAIIYRIKSICAGSEGGTDAVPNSIFNTDVLSEEIVLGRRAYKIRRVFLVAFHNYSIGWVVDCDMSVCMICMAGFGWMRYRHHCRLNLELSHVLLVFSLLCPFFFLLFFVCLEISDLVGP